MQIRIVSKDMSIKSEVYEFFVEGKNHHLSHVLLHIASPGKPDGENQGYFFVLAEMDDPESSVLQILEDLIRDGENLYYGGYDQETTHASDPEARHFESVIEKLNRKTKILLNDASGRKIHMAVGMIQGNRISFAYRGEMMALLAYNIAEGPSFTPIVEEGSYPEHMFFSSVIEGNFTLEEAVYISTPHVIKYFSRDRIAKMISGKPAKQSVLQIQKTLEGISSEYSFGGLVVTGSEIQMELPKAPKPNYRPNIGSEESMDRLLDTTRSTEDTLSPKVFSHIARSFTNNLKKNEDTDEDTEIRHAVKETNPGRYRRKRREERNPATEGGSSLLIVLGKVIVWTLKALFYVVKTILFALGKCLAIFWTLATNYNGGRKILIDQYKSAFTRIIDKFTGLGIFGKILLLILVVGIGILIGSIMYTKEKEKVTAREEVYAAEMSSLDETKKEADAYLLYGDHAKALESVRRASEKLASLTHDTTDKQKRADELKAELDKLLLKVQKITAITPDKIVDIREAHPTADTNSLVFMGDRLIASGAHDTSLYFVSTLTGLVEKKNAETLRELANGYTAKDASQIVFTSGDNAIVAYNKETDSIISKTITYPNQNVVLADIALYNGRLYALDRGNGALYRHNPTQVGFDSGTSWVTSQTDPAALKNGVSFALDGDLYVLTTNGKVLKYTSGIEQSFTISGLDPVLDSPTQIETRSEFANIYILEPSKKRIVVLDKNGNFKKQFQSDIWQNPTGFAITDTEKEVYVLDGTTIYKFKL